MKKLILAASIAAVGLSFSAQADDSEASGVYVNFGANYFDYDSTRRIDNNGAPYLGFGYQANDHWGFELEYTKVATDYSSPLVGDFDLELITLNSIYRLNPRGTSTVFYKMGVGPYREKTLDYKENAFRLGIGYDFATSEKFSWLIGLDSEHTDDNSDWSVYGGISYFFGNTGNKAAPAPAPVKQEAPKDSDNDGVFDANDRCPSTPANTPVDANGCALDSDNDGVIDTLDQCASTPAGAKVDAKGCRIMLTEDVSIKLQVQFANNSNVVSDSYRSEIQKVANFMRQYPDTTVVIEGHTDSRGAAAYNQQLSQKRATAVMQYLVDNFSVDAARVTAAGKGEGYPIADNNTAEGRAANRRVQAEIKTTVTKPKE